MPHSLNIDENEKVLNLLIFSSAKFNETEEV